MPYQCLATWRTAGAARVLVVAAICVLLSACSGPASKPGTAASQPAVRDALYRQYNEWRGVPYRLGGVSKSGVDCSALVQITYKNLFSMDLPRNTWDQSRVGSVVKPGERRSGDLVFFKTDMWGNHVGIYLEDGRFMHASASRGVMISNLEDTYWKRHYWKTLRPMASSLVSR